MEYRLYKRSEIDTEAWENCLNTGDFRTVYAHYWYLDAICNFHWEALIFGDYEKVFPLPVNRKLLGFKQVYQPALCQQLGLFGKDITQTELEKAIHFIKKRYLRVNTNINHHNLELLAGSESIWPKTNMLLDLNRDYEEIQQGYSKALRKRIRKWKQVLAVRTVLDVAGLCRFYFENLNSKLQVPISVQKQIEHLLNAVIQNNRGEILEVINEQGEPICMGFFIKDFGRIYNVFGASNTEGREKHAMAVLLDFMVENNSRKAQFLDFEGSEIEGVATFFSSFGTQIEKYGVLRSKLYGR
ncbi:MAG: hypothetical protein ACPF8V_04685 [Luteibaculum sp.]